MLEKNGLPTQTEKSASTTKDKTAGATFAPSESDKLFDAAFDHQKKVVKEASSKGKPKK